MTNDVKTYSIYQCAFSWSNPNPYDNLNKMKLNLKVSTKQGQI